MKVRIGFGLGTRTSLHGPQYGHVVDQLEHLGFDSLWLSEKISGEAPDPLVAMAFGAGRTTTLKFGTSVMVLPGRNPMVLAKELATLAVMSGGRLLPAFGLGAVDPIEQQAFGVQRGDRAGWFDEALTVMRACWSGHPVHHAGERFRYDGVQVLPAPERLDVWLGGFAPSELRRVGRLGDGWLPSFVTPAEAQAGRQVIERTCVEHERSIDDDHYGVLIPYCLGPVPDALLTALSARRPGLDPAALVPTSWEQLVTTINSFVDIGTSKFVILPVVEPGHDGRGTGDSNDGNSNDGNSNSDTADAWSSHLRDAADAVLSLET